MNRKVFRASLDELYSMLMWIQDAIKSVGFEKRDLRKIELATEEALVNVILHGYSKKPGFIEIEIHSSSKKSEKSEKKVDIVIKDQGPYFNPLEEEREIDPKLPLEERDIGGIGIVLIRQYMDNVQYRREDPYNILILTKKC